MLKTTHTNPRHGLTIIEVLTSIVVAMIGVFGVMILIPFAVKQAKTGLDSDAGVQVARNAYSQFEISGYRNPGNWIKSDGNAYRPFDGPDEPRVYSIDPVGITENGDTYTDFPRPASAVVIESVNLRRPGNPVQPMDVALARRMFRSSDDLVFGEATDELLGPEQLFDTAGGLPLRRQSIGRISWSAIVVPFKTDATTTSTSRWSYKMYILVYKDRKTLISDPEGGMITSLLEPTQNTGAHSPVTNVYFKPGVYVQPTATTIGVNRDDWVMLINTDTLAETGFDRQIAFYRVVSVADGAGTPDASNRSTLSTMTLDGPDFNFGSLDTYAVHLNDVIGVYERTFAPESASNWNVSF